MPPPDIPAVVYIRRNSDGEVRQYLIDFSVEVGDFLWSDGNYACDCNRAQFFARAGGDKRDPNAICGMDLYDVRIEARCDGRELYRDEDWDGRANSQTPNDG